MIVRKVIRQLLVSATGAVPAYLIGTHYGLAAEAGYFALWFVGLVVWKMLTSHPEPRFHSGFPDKDSALHVVWHEQNPDRKCPSPDLLDFDREHVLLLTEREEFMDRLRARRSAVAQK